MLLSILARSGGSDYTYGVKYTVMCASALPLMHKLTLFFIVSTKG